MGVRGWFALTLVVGVSLALNLARLVDKFGHWPGPHYVDRITAYEERCASIRAAAQRHPLIGHHIGLPGPEDSKELRWANGWRHYAAQYTLAPAIVIDGTDAPVILDDPYIGPVSLVERRP